MISCVWFILEKNSEPDASGQQRPAKRGIDEKSKETKKVRLNDEEDSDSEESDSSTDTEEDITPAGTKQQDNDGKKVTPKGNDFEVVPVEDNSKSKQKILSDFPSLSVETRWS